MSRIAVVGVGAIGCVFGGYLAATGRHEMIFCSREIFSEVSVENDFCKVNAPAHTVMEPTGLEPADWVFLATKAHQVGGAAGWLEVLCGPNTQVAVLQNGVDHVERVSPFTGQGNTCCGELSGFEAWPWACIPYSTGGAARCSSR
jgi:2-dehydropantoate 2-reductase